MNLSPRSAAVALLAAVVLAHILWLAEGGTFINGIVLGIFVSIAILAVTAGLSRWCNFFVRTIVGLELLGSVADRFGLLGAPGDTTVFWGSFAFFLDYVRLLLPPPMVGAAPVVGVAATAAEIVVGVLLVIGIRRSSVAAAGALLLAAFALAMVTSVGVTATAEYAVVPQGAALLLLALPLTPSRGARPISRGVDARPSGSLVA